MPTNADNGDVDEDEDDGEGGMCGKKMKKG